MRICLLTLIVAAGIAGFSPRATTPVSVVETRYATGRLESRAHTQGGRRTGRFESWWPDGVRRSSAEYLEGVFHGEYRTWTSEGRPYELRHFERGREAGVQQSWDERGELYLNYEVKHGRRHGLVNAKPCLPADRHGISTRVAP